MNYSISQLIEIYETELSTLIQPSNPSGRMRLSTISIPVKGQTVTLSNQQFRIESVERFMDFKPTSSIDDLLSDEDKKIIHELEAEGDTPIDNDGEFDDDPYPDPDQLSGGEWDIGGEGDQINMNDHPAGFMENDSDVKWKDANAGDDKETTIAYYRPFHSAGMAFGIYYKRNGLKLKTRLIFEFCRQRGYQVTRQQVYLIAKIMTQFHEIYHHKVESIASRIEVVSRKPIYLGGFSNWYKRTRGLALCYEETFANCYAYQKTMQVLKPFLPVTALHNMMVFWFNAQPTPYRNALQLIQNKTNLWRFKENQFFEIILNKFFPGDPRYGKQHSKVWSMFTHGSHPYINTNSNVYFIV